MATLIEIVTSYVENGRLTRGTSVIVDDCKGRTDAEIAQLRDWARAHKSTAVSRYVGETAAGELRFRARQQSK